MSEVMYLYLSGIDYGLSVMTIPSHESQRSCIFVLGVLINGLSEVTVPSHESQR